MMIINEHEVPLAKANDAVEEGKIVGFRKYDYTPAPSYVHGESQRAKSTDVNERI